MKNFTALVVDDERLARQSLTRMLSEFSIFKNIEEANNISTAVSKIKQIKPDVIFLDIQMPGESGFDLFGKVTVNFDVIFVTAHDNYAIKAFEENALDYLLKPINPERLKNSINRLISKSGDNEEQNFFDYDERLFISARESLKIIKVNSVVCIKADGDYTRVITEDGKEFIVLKKLKDWEDKLPKKYFGRIHRSAIINYEFINKIEKWFNYSYRVFLKNLNEPLILSRSYARILKDKMIW